MEPKEVQYTPIQYIGLENVDEDDRVLLDKISGEYYTKIQRSIKNITSMVVHVKDYTKGGGKKKFSIHARVSGPAASRMFEATFADWDFARTLHRVFNDIQEEIQHRLHTDDQKLKYISKKKEKNVTPQFAKKIGIKPKPHFMSR